MPKEIKDLPPAETVARYEARHKAVGAIASSVYAFLASEHPNNRMNALAFGVVASITAGIDDESWDKMMSVVPQGEREMMVILALDVIRRYGVVTLPHTQATIQDLKKRANG